MIAYIVDIETGGLDYQKHSLLEIGILAVNFEPCGLWSYERGFYERIKPSMLCMSPFAMDMHMKNGLLKECLVHGKPEEEVRDAYLAWISGKKIAAGFNPKFDTQWLSHWSGKDFFDYRVIDPRQNWLKIGDNRVPDTAEAYRRAGLKPPTLKHRAISDCMAVLPLLTKMMDCKPRNWCS